MKDSLREDLPFGIKFKPKIDSGIDSRIDSGIDSGIGSGSGAGSGDKSEPASALAQSSPKSLPDSSPENLAENFSKIFPSGLSENLGQNLTEVSTNTAPYPVLEARKLSHNFWQKKTFFSVRQAFWAVKDLDLTLDAGLTLGLIGESGCGKSTLARIISGLMPPTEGAVFIKGKNLYNKSEHQDYALFRKKVCSEMQMIFQDPNSSLNPRMRVEDSVAEPLVCLNKELGKVAVRDRVGEILKQVGIAPDHGSKYPHAFSGGQRQRIAIARALITSPDLLICDEPTSSLDSSVQAQILNLLDDMQSRLNLSYIFISHDLSVVRHMSDHVAVMYKGYIVEEGRVEDVFTRAGHPYTKLLLESVPSFGFLEAKKPIDTEQGSESSAELEFLPEKACPFFLRCALKFDKCLKALPELKLVQGKKDENTLAKKHRVRCFLVD